MNELLKTVKNEVELKYGTSVRYAKDCQNLADDVLRQTGRQISSSTLKRFFGIISSKFNPSAYTLDTLVNYLGFVDWKDYLNSYQVHENSDNSTSWERLSERVDIVTESSLSNIKNKIDYKDETFIKRNYVTHMFKGFYESNDNALILLAPEGYGKSSSIIQFYNWMTEDYKRENDILCIIEGSMFYHKVLEYNDYDLPKQLIEFNLQHSLNEYFRKHKEQIKGKFIIVIDDVDEVFLDKEKYHLFIGNLFKILQAYINMPWFKMVLTCRPTNYKPFEYFLQKNPVLSEYCYDYFKQDEFHINMPLLTDNELKEIISKRGNGIDLSYIRFYYSDLFNLVRYPMFLDVIIDALIQKQFISEVEIINQTIATKLYSGPYNEEKHALIDLFLNLSHLGRETTIIPKNELIRSSSASLAYNELLSLGIICEKEVYDKYLQKECFVEFTQKILLEYLIAINWAKSYTLDTELFKVLEEYYSENKMMRCKVFKWLVKLLFENDSLKTIKDLHVYAEAESYELNGDYKVPCYCEDLAKAVKVKMRQKQEFRQELLPWFATTKIGRYLYFEHYFDVDALMIYDIEFINDYLAHCNNCKSKLTALFLKFMHAFFDNDTICARSAYEEVQDIDIPKPEDVGLYFRYFAILILYKDKFEGSFPDEILAQAISNIDNELSQTTLAKIYTRLIFILYLTSEPKQVIEVADDLSKISNWSDKTSASYLKLFQLIYADALQRKGNRAKAEDLYNKAVLLEGADVKSLFLKMCQIASELEVELALELPVDGENKLAELHQISKLLNNHYFEDKLKDLVE